MWVGGGGGGGYLEDLRGLAQGARGVDHVVDDDGVAPDQWGGRVGGREGVRVGKGKKRIKLGIVVRER